MRLFILLPFLALACQPKQSPPADSEADADTDTDTDADTDADAPFFDDFEGDPVGTSVDAHGAWTCCGAPCLATISGDDFHSVSQAASVPHDEAGGPGLALAEFGEDFKLSLWFTERGEGGQDLFFLLRGATGVARQVGYKADCGDGYWLVFQDTGTCAQRIADRRSGWQELTVEVDYAAQQATWCFGGDCHVEGSFGLVVEDLCLVDDGLEGFFVDDVAVGRR